MPIHRGRPAFCSSGQGGTKPSQARHSPCKKICFHRQQQRGYQTKVVDLTAGSCSGRSIGERHMPSAPSPAASHSAYCSPPHSRGERQGRCHRLWHPHWSLGEGESEQNFAGLQKHKMKSKLWRICEDNYNTI